MKIAVLGAGSFGTAIAVHLARRGHHVRLWGRRREHLESSRTQGRNTRFLTEIPFPEGLTAEPDLEQSLEGCEFVVSAIPTKGIAAFWSEHAARVPDGIPVVNAAKGISTAGLETVDEIFRECFGRLRSGQIVFLSGPSFALELAKGKPTLLLLAGRDDSIVEQARTVFNGGQVKAYISDDVIGVVLGGAIKNVIAIATGIADGMNAGTNARAGLITRGLHEMNRLATRLGANPLTLSGLAGMGDLVLTCTGDLSRNRRLGMAIGQGKTLDQALEAMQGQIAEGLYTADAVAQLSQRHDLDMPICMTTAAVLNGTLTAEEGLRQLLARPTRHERA